MVLVIVVSFFLGGDSWRYMLPDRARPISATENLISAMPRAFPPSAKSYVQRWNHSRQGPYALHRHFCAVRAEANTTRTFSCRLPSFAIAAIVGKSPPFLAKKSKCVSMNRSAVQVIRNFLDWLFTDDMAVSFFVFWRRADDISR
jgi:hypothetical protein